MVISDWIEANSIWIVLAVTILVLIYFIVNLIQRLRGHPTASRLTVILLILGLIFLIYMVFNASEIGRAQWAEILLLIGLVTITAVYASSATRQARASVKMAEEMMEQRVIASRPIIIQEAISRKYISEKDEPDYFQVYNAGNGPAIELEMSILNENKTPIVSERKTFLRSGEPPIQFMPFQSADLDESTYYLVCEYQGILSPLPKKTWYQTWLPFDLKKSSKTGKAIVKAGELTFEEVTEDARIDAFSSRGKPK